VIPRCAVGSSPPLFVVVIRRHAGATPFGVLIGLGRQRHQGGPIDRVEELAAAGAELAHQTDVEIVDQDADRDVQLGEREEAPIAYTPHGRATNPDRSGDHPIARPTGILQAKNFSNLPHRQSLGGHRTSHCVNRKRRTLPRSDCRQRSPSHPSTGWPPSFGLGGRFSTESMAAFRRNRCRFASDSASTRSRCRIRWKIQVQ